MTYLTFQEDRRRHAKILRRGLKRLGRNLAVDSCPFCHGETQRAQTYNNGCGGGSHQGIGPCDFCDETGLVYTETRRGVPKSVAIQVKNAGENTP